MKWCKWVLALGTCMVLGSTQTQAQIWVGPKVGMQTSRFFFADPDAAEVYNERWWLGWQAGWVANYDVSSHWSLATDYAYSRKSRSHTAVFDNEVIKFYRATYGFLDASALLRYSIGEMPRHYYFNVGPVVSLWTDGRGRIRTGFTDRAEYLRGYTYGLAFKRENQEQFEEMYVQDANRFQVGIEVGIGAQFDILYDKRLQIDLRYQMGHTHLAKEESGDFGLPGIVFTDNFEGVLHTFSISASILSAFDFIEPKTRGY